MQNASHKFFGGWWGTKIRKLWGVQRLPFCFKGAQQPCQLLRTIIHQYHSTTVVWTYHATLHFLLTAFPSSADLPHYKGSFAAARTRQYICRRHQPSPHWHPLHDRRQTDLWTSVGWGWTGEPVTPRRPWRQPTIANPNTAVKDAGRVRSSRR